MYRPEFIISIGYEIWRPKLDEFIRQQHAVSESGNSDLHFIIKEAENLRSNNSTTVCIELEYDIPQNYLDSINNTSRYIENLDVLLSVLPIDEVPPHPFSRGDTYMAFTDKAQDKLMKNKMFKMIEIVDNEDVCGPRFTKIDGAIFRINPTRDPIRTSGIYYYYNQNDKITPNPESYIRTKVYTFEDGDKALDLHRTREGAEYAEMDRQEKAKRELAELNNAIQRLKAEQAERDLEIENFRKEKELSYESAKYAAKMSEMEAAARLAEDKFRIERQLNEERLRHENMKMTNDRLRAEMDSRTYIWKSSSDNLKSIIAIVSSVTALGLLIWKASHSMKP
jgi:hypothetical protein